MNRSEKTMLSATVVLVTISCAALGFILLRPRAARPATAISASLRPAGAADAAASQPSSAALSPMAVTPTPTATAAEPAAASADGGAPVGACIYASHSTFHLRSRPVFSSARATEVVTRPRIEVLRGGSMQRGPEGMFQVRFLDGTAREGWMFIPLFELDPACSTVPGMPSNIGPAAGARSAGQSRIERDLAECDLYVAEVRSRRAVARALQRSGSPRFESYVEGFERWLERQQSGRFGRAMEHLRATMERWQEQENNEGRSTIRSRAQLLREVSARCQP